MKLRTHLINPEFVTTSRGAVGILARIIKQRAPRSSPTVYERLLAPALVVICCSTVPHCRGDQIQMRNGDQYFGKVLSLNEQTLVVQSDVLGTIRLPRGKVAFVDFGASQPENKPTAFVVTNKPPHSVALTITNQPGDLSAALSQFGGSSNALQQIEKQLLSDGGPEAKAKFNEMFGGLLSGKLSIGDIRAQAQTTADQVRSLRKDLGEDAGSLIDGYLAILDSFLNETAPPKTPATNAPPAPLKPKGNLLEAE